MHYKQPFIAVAGESEAMFVVFTLHTVSSLIYNNVLYLEMMMLVIGKI